MGRLLEEAAHHDDATWCDRSVMDENKGEILVWTE